MVTFILVTFCKVKFAAPCLAPLSLIRSSTNTISCLYLEGLQVSSVRLGYGSLLWVRLAVLHLTPLLHYSVSLPFIAMECVTQTLIRYVKSHIYHSLSPCGVMRAISVIK